jgi:hypothetical protein
MVTDKIIQILRAKNWQVEKRSGEVLPYVVD